MYEEQEDEDEITHATTNKESPKGSKIVTQVDKGESDPDVEEIPEDFFIKDQIVVGP